MDDFYKNIKYNIILKPEKCDYTNKLKMYWIFVKKLQY